MTVVANDIRKGFYLDSVALMRISRTLTGLPGIEEAGLMIGTPANKEILREAGVLADNGEAAAAGDLVIAIRATDKTAADAALAEAARLLDAPRQTGGASIWRPRTLRAALAQTPDASLALISVPGDFAAAEALKAIRTGLDVMMFSDNVPIEQEVELKREARTLGRLVMGPDCGTAIIGGVPLAFANVVPRGDIGIIGASGTGIQEISCLIARAGHGISHAIGTGGRDLKKEVGGITTLMAIDLLDADPATRHIVIVSKPPATEVAKAVLERVSKSKRPFTICFLGGEPQTVPSNVQYAHTLQQAAEMAVGHALASSVHSDAPHRKAAGRLIRGLYTGGTLCAEAQVILRAAGIDVASNVPIPGATALGGTANGHTLIDLGDDQFTRGRPHPMIEPAVRDAPLRAALSDAAASVILLDCVLGYGGHPDPAGHLAGVLANRPKDTPSVVASVTGTDDDPQNYSTQVAKLTDVGIHVEPSNAAAVRFALRTLGK